MTAEATIAAVARRWADARHAFLALPSGSSAVRARLNDLADSEDFLARTVRSCDTGVVPILFRPHRGGLAEAMAEVRPVWSKAELVAIITGDLARFEFTVGATVIEPHGFDERISWDTHIVTVRGFGVYGFTSGPLQ